MVDLEDLESEKKGSSSSSSSGNGGGSSASKGSKTSGEKSSSSSSESSGTFSMSEEGMVGTEGKSVSDVSKNWASDKGELNTDAHSGEGLKAYMNRQVKEVEELHDNIHEMAMDNNENFDEFTLFMHALFLNFGRNRVGIIDTIENQFGKSRREAYELTNKICERAGEKEFMEQMVRDITKNLADL